jgi:hypothetical protein
MAHANFYKTASQPRSANTATCPLNGERNGRTIGRKLKIAQRNARRESKYFCKKSITPQINIEG